MECNWEQKVACDLFFLEFTCCSFEAIILGDIPVISMGERPALQRSGPSVNFTQWGILGCGVLDYLKIYLLQQSHWLLFNYLKAPQLAQQYVWACLLNLVADLYPKMHPTHLAHLRANTAKVICRWHEARNGRRTKDTSLKEMSLAMHSSPWTVDSCKKTAARTLLSAGTTVQFCVLTLL